MNLSIPYKWLLQRVNTLQCSSLKLRSVSRCAYHVPSHSKPTTYRHTLSYQSLNTAQKLHTNKTHNLNKSSKNVQSNKPIVTKSDDNTTPFTQLKLLPDTVRAVHNALTPTATATTVQKLAIKHILNVYNNKASNNHTIIASQTGSGKTLAYLLPVIDCLKNDETVHNITTRLERPRGIVLAPSRELAEQIYSVSKQLTHSAKLRCALLLSGISSKRIQSMLQQPIDLLISTVGQLHQYIKDEKLSLHDCRYMVIDEADTMFDEKAGWVPELKLIIDIWQKRQKQSTIVSNTTQLIGVSASINKHAITSIQQYLPDATIIATNTLHKLPTTLKQQFINVGNNNKLTVLQYILDNQVDHANSTVIFCNTLQSCRAVDHYLTEREYNIASYHGAIPPKERIEQFEQFKSQAKNILVCTDLAARGLDILHIQHVIMFDFPLNSVDYLHRAGRTGRAGAIGYVTSLVKGGDRVLAEAIKRAFMANETINALSSDKQSYRTDRPATVKHTKTVSSNPKPVTHTIGSKSAQPTRTPKSGAGKVLGRYSGLMSAGKKAVMQRQAASKRKTKLDRHQRTHDKYAVKSKRPHDTRQPSRR